MSWQSFIHKLEKDFRISAPDLERRASMDRHVFYELKSGKTTKPHQSTIRKLEQGLNIKIDDSDLNNIVYTQNLFDKDIELFSVESNEYPIVSHIEDRQGVFSPQNIIGKITLPYSKKINCFVLLINNELQGDILDINDKLLVDMDMSINNGNLVAVSLTGGEQLVRYYRCLPEGLIQFYSGNIKEDTLIVKRDQIKALYKIVMLFRNL